MPLWAGLSPQASYPLMPGEVKGTFVPFEVDLSLPGATAATGRLFKNVDGIKFLNHPGGCGGTRQDGALLARLLAAYADHPNVGGVTVLSLGCQILQVQDLLDAVHARNPLRDVTVGGGSLPALSPPRVLNRKAAATARPAMKDGSAFFFSSVALISPISSARVSAMADR